MTTYRYKNLSGKSSVYKYYLYSRKRYKIKIKFKPKSRFGGDKTIKYSYSYDSAGYSTVKKMRRLAKDGAGLNTFINHNQPRYYKKS